MNYIEAIFNLLRNKTLNSLGVERDLMRLIQDRDISQVISLLQDRDIDFIIEEYEEVPDPAPSTLIKPEEKKLIV